jgi:lysozyme
MAKRLLPGVLIILILFCFAAAFGLWHLKAFSPDRHRYPVRGIDASHHQKTIDWRRVAADDVTFAIIKATEGGDHIDSLFAINLAEAREAGLAVGAYHFFTFCRPGVDQAGNFIATVPRDQRLLPPVVDVEFHGNCPQRPTPEKLRAELAAFLGPVEAHFGKPAIIYLPDDAAEEYGSIMPDRLRWVRSLAMHPGREDWVYWQYDDKGRVDGIEGDVDLNVLQGLPARLTELARRLPDSNPAGTPLSR